MASVVNVTFPQAKALFQHLRVYLHDNYDPTTYANNLAIVKLQTATVPDGSELTFLLILHFSHLSDIFRGSHVCKIVNQRRHRCISLPGGASLWLWICRQLPHIPEDHDVHKTVRPTGRRMQLPSEDHLHALGRQRQQHLHQRLRITDLHSRLCRLDHHQAGHWTRESLTGHSQKCTVLRWPQGCARSSRRLC
jgi:hypothetical protein